MTDYVVRDTQLTSVADAIRAKGGTSDPMSFPDGFVSAVEAIPTGGGPVSVPAKEVNFRDYDGTVVYSYTPAEFAALSAMPANPDHSGDEIPLTAQGWNWSFADAQAYVAKYGRLEVGQMYITTDGKTHIKIYIDPDTSANRMTFCLRWTQSVSNGVTVDWGDGSATQTYSGTEAEIHGHTYAAGGWYDITLYVTAGNISFTGETNYCIFGAYNDGNRYLYNRIRNVRLGNGLSAEALDGYTFYGCIWLTDITIPNSIVSLGSYTFDFCYMLTSVTVPWSVSTLKSNVFTNAYIYSASLPRGITELPRTFYQAYCLKYVSIPDTVISYEYTFRGCYSLEFLTSPESVQTIGTNSFIQCGIGEYHFTSATPPVLSVVANNIFGNGYDNFIIYVPRGSLSAYQSATNWSAIASNIREEPQ